MTFEDVTAPPSLKRIAWHEAGHAVAGWDQGIASDLVSIRPAGDGSSLGRCTPRPTEDCTIASLNIMAMGGWAAELASGEVKDDNRTYDHGDLQCLANRTPEDRFAMDLGSAEQEAERIVRSNLDRIERLAGVLLERTELSDAAEIKAIIEG